MGDQIRIRPERLASAVMDAIYETRGLTEIALKRAVDKTARQVVSDIKKAAPVKTGKYKRGWRTKMTELSRRGRGDYGKIAHNKPCYRLTHLLQHGHGGPRPARAYPHIPSDAETEALFVQNLESEMGKG